MDLIHKIEKGYFSKNMLTEESWKYVIGLISKSINENKQDWFDFFAEYLKMYLAYKYFTNKKQYVDNAKIVDYLKLNLKTYYSALISIEDSKQILFKIKMLPIDLVYLLIRQCFNLSPTLKTTILIKKKELKEFIKKLKTIRKKIAKNVDNISLQYESVFDLSEFMLAYNCGVFFEDNFINQGIMEFVDKLFKKEQATKKAIDLGLISKSEILGLKENIKTFPSYSGYMRNKQKCFEDNGLQIGRRFQDYLDMLNNISDGDYVIDNKSIYKEPYMYLNQYEFTEDGAAESDFEESTESVSNSGGGGNTFSNTADIDVPDMGGEFADESGDVDTAAAQNEFNTDETDEELPEEFGEE